MNIIVMISADAEWRSVKSILRIATKLQISPYGEYFAHDLIGRSGKRHSVLFFQSGWGKIAAAASTQYVIDAWHPLLLVNLGTCGGFEGDVTRGTVILVNKTIVYDIFEQMGDAEAHIAHYTTSLDLSWLVPPYPENVQPGLMVSGDRDLVIEEISDLKKRYGAVVGDWESGAIAWVAHQNDIRLLILRGVSDLVGSDGGEAYCNIEMFNLSAGVIMSRLLQSLPDWLERVVGT